MDKVSIRSYKIIQLLALSFTLLIGFLYSNSARAYISPSQPSSQQLSYLIAQRPPAHFHHHHAKRFYWTRGRHVGRGCRRSCLVDRWSGRVIRCRTICR